MAFSASRHRCRRPPQLGYSNQLINQLFLLLLGGVVGNPALSGVYDVVWDSPSSSIVDSMPIGGYGGLGANVWVEDGK